MELEIVAGGGEGCSAPGLQIVIETRKAVVAATASLLSACMQQNHVRIRVPADHGQSLPIR